MPVAKTKTIYPVTLAEAKRHLRIDADYDDENDYIRSVIKAATLEAENYIGKDIAYTSNVASLFDFSGDTITLREGNVIEVTEVITDTSVSASIGVARIYDNYTKILLTETINSTTDYTPMQVKYTSGYGEDDCPLEIQQAILIKIANMFDVNREDATPGYMKEGFASNNLLNPHKIILW